MSRQKDKGTRAESAVRDFLRGHGFGAERMPAGAAADRGDLAGVPGWTLEVKDYADVARALREAIDELQVEQANAGTPHGAAVVKRARRSNPADWYFVMRLGDAVPIMRQVQS